MVPDRDRLGPLHVGITGDRSLGMGLRLLEQTLLQVQDARPAAAVTAAPRTHSFRSVATRSLRLRERFSGSLAAAPQRFGQLGFEPGVDVFIGTLYGQAAVLQIGQQGGQGGAAGRSSLVGGRMPQCCSLSARARG